MNPTESRQALDPLTLRFREDPLEQDFNREQAQKSLRPLRMAALSSLAFSVLLWAALGYLVPGLPPALERFPLVLAVVTIIGPLYAFTYTPAFERHRQAVGLVGTTTIALMLMVLARLLPADIRPAYAYTLVAIHILNSYTLLHLRFLTCMAAGWLGTLLYGLVLADALPPGELPRHLAVLVTCNLFGAVAAYQSDLYLRREFLATRLLAEERARSERLLLNVLPAPIAARLKQQEGSIADRFGEVTVLFADIVGFTPLSSKKSPDELVALLNQIFTAFDTLAERHGLEKIKTIGDAYMAAAGIPTPRPDHAQAVAAMAQDMVTELARLSAAVGEPLALRIGLHSGPVVAGVIGKRKFSYDLWGDTVNTASRMESHGLPGQVHLSETTAGLLRGQFTLEPRGAIQVKGKGEMTTYLLGPRVEEKAAG